MTRTRSLGTRLTVLATLWIVVLLAGGGYALSYTFTKSAEESFERELDIFLGALVSSVKIDSEGNASVSREIEDPRFGQVFSGWYWQVSRRDMVILRSRSLWDEQLNPELPLTTVGTVTEAYFSGPRGRTLCARARTLGVGANGEPITYMVTGDTDEIDRQRIQFNTILSISLGLLGIGALAAILLQVRFGLAPLRTVTRELEGIRNGTRSHLTNNHPKEMMPLINAMNQVLEENQSRIDRARKQVGNLAHALKTPLTLLRAIMQKSRHADSLDAEQQLESISELIDHHMSRAAAVGNAAYISTIIDAAEIIHAIREGLTRIYADRDVRVDLEIAPGLTFLGERQDAEELFGNLIENACKWAKHRVRVKGEIKGKKLLIRVDDDGDGIPKPLNTQAIIRGKRLDEQSPGFGLGLSIVADLLDIYGGELEFHNSDLGGLSVLVSLPHSPGERED